MYTATNGVTTTVGVIGATSTSGFTDIPIVGDWNGDGISKPGLPA